MPGYEGLRLYENGCRSVSFYIAVISCNIKNANNCHQSSPLPLISSIRSPSSGLFKPYKHKPSSCYGNHYKISPICLLQMQRRNSDLIETGLRKRTLTHTSSVNLPRTLSTSNLSRSISGSITNLAKTSPRMVRSCSSSSFSAVELGTRSGRQDPLIKTQVSILC